jgi:hypothetical protein
VNVVAYGALMHRPSLEATLRRPARLNRLTIPGWRRVFDAAFPDGLAYLNLRPALSTQIQAAWFNVAEPELRLFADREAGSDLVEVLPGFHAFVWPEARCREFPVLSSYVDICRRGAKALGIDLAQGTTWPATIRNDSANPAYR